MVISEQSLQEHIVCAFTEQPQQPPNTPIFLATYSSTISTAQTAQWSNSWGGTG